MVMPRSQASFSSDKHKRSSGKRRNNQPSTEAIEKEEEWIPRCGNWRPLSGLGWLGPAVLCLSHLAHKNHPEVVDITREQKRKRRTSPGSKIETTGDHQGEKVTKQGITREQEGRGIGVNGRGSHIGNADIREGTTSPSHLAKHSACLRKSPLVFLLLVFTAMPFV